MSLHSKTNDQILLSLLIQSVDMSISEIQLYNILKQKLGDQEASTLVDFVKAEINQELDSRQVSTKKDLLEQKIDLIKWMVGFWLTQMAAIIGLYLSR